MNSEATVYLEAANEVLADAGLTMDDLYAHLDNPARKRKLPPDIRAQAAIANDFVASTYIFKHCPDLGQRLTFPSPIARQFMRNHPDMLIEPPQFDTSIIIIDFTEPLPELGFLSGQFADRSLYPQPQSINKLLYYYNDVIGYANAIAIHPGISVNRVIFHPAERGTFSHAHHGFSAPPSTISERNTYQDKQRILNLALFCLQYLKNKHKIA